jgi:hypothetical protein
MLAGGAFSGSGISPRFAARHAEQGLERPGAEAEALQRAETPVF